MVGGRRPRPKRALGQNFLVDPNLRRRIAEEARIRPGETVLEVGPGRGALTGHLALQADRLVLVELDDDLAAALEERFRGDDHVEVVHRDVLQVSVADVTSEPGRLRVVGNIPYNLTTPILFHLLEPPRPVEILLTVQKEVADRILAEPGSREYGALSVGVRTVATVERVLAVPPGAFRPRPRVDSAVIRITPFRPPPLTPAEEASLRDLTRAVFQWRRKQLQKTLRDHPDLGLDRERVARLAERTGFDLTSRPETLSPEEFVRLSRALDRLAADSR
jgi:16S rRNA (adenine1518-N6/adenine1519-N6)-dimethyltransferase